MKILNDFDLNKNRILNPVLHPASSAPSSPNAAQVYFDTSGKTLMLYDGTQWRDVGGTAATSAEIEVVLSNAGFGN